MLNSEKLWAQITHSLWQSNLYQRNSFIFSKLSIFLWVMWVYVTFQPIWQITLSCPLWNKSILSLAPHTPIWLIPPYSWARGSWMYNRLSRSASSWTPHSLRTRIWSRLRPTGAGTGHSVAVTQSPWTHYKISVVKVLRKAMIVMKIRFYRIQQSLMSWQCYHEYTYLFCLHFLFPIEF